jgi:hypothetical protein
MLLPAGVIDEMERSSISSMTPAGSNIGGLPEAVNTVKCFLMMGENIARNM